MGNLLQSKRSQLTALLETAAKFASLRGCRKVHSSCRTGGILEICSFGTEQSQIAIPKLESKKKHLYSCQSIVRLDVGFAVWPMHASNHVSSAWSTCPWHGQLTWFKRLHSHAAGIHSLFRWDSNCKRFLFTRRMTANIWYACSLCDASALGVKYDIIHELHKYTSTNLHVRLKTLISVRGHFRARLRSLFECSIGMSDAIVFTFLTIFYSRDSF